MCIRDLRRKYPDDPRWQIVTARVLPRDLDPKKLAILLADWHVAGKVDWDAHEKAGQVYHMNKALGIPFDEILVHLHASKSTVNRWFKAYEFMFERYSTANGGKYAKEREGKWSYFDELYRSKELRQRLDAEAEFGDKGECADRHGPLAPHCHLPVPSRSGSRWMPGRFRLACFIPAHRSPGAWNETTGEPCRSHRRSVSCRAAFQARDRVRSGFQ